MTISSATGIIHIDPDRRPIKTSNTTWRIRLTLVILAFLLIWQAAVAWFKLIPSNFLPAPTEVSVAFGELVVNPNFWSALAFSLGNMAVGLAMAIGVGVFVGIALGLSPALRITVAPFLWLLYSTPKVALAPIFILALGLGSASKIGLVFLLAVFPVLLNTMEGTLTVSPSLVNAARVYGASRFSVGWKIIAPATLPFSLVGIQRAVALGFTGEILGEFLGGAGGIGHMLEYAAYKFLMDEALAIVFVMVIVSNLSLGLISIVRRKLAPWDTDQKGM
ncbi:putative ABC transporter membrane protein [marine actinobacterium PHSC20C1]|nr:putative ABC transporter membrane protein [marine actinobacterium PHSC20C1]